ncbi:MAG: exodeoxyribonuclease V subunit gamma [Myxococcota bacterium]|nr:exodeoxyribonuclease V subunit gamma [Myxococcota bacterium]MDW8361224.1 exodeoxyribonuclease V subunit gamma [Myxococcales bacterium]
MALWIHRSNGLHELADMLAERIRQDRGSLFEPVRICVPARGMERWLQLRLAERTGVCAGVTFPFPRALIEWLVDRFGRPASSDGSWDHEALVWAIARRLRAFDGLTRVDAATAIDAERADAWEARQRLRLAASLARFFDDCLVYDPERVLGWERCQTAWPPQASLGSGSRPEGTWPLHAETDLAALWNAAVELVGGQHLARRASELFEAPQDRNTPAERERFAAVYLFGISTLPRLFLDVLGAVADRIDVHLFVWTPSREWMPDLEGADGRGERPAGSNEAETPVLLATMGRIAAGFQRALAELDAGRGEDRFVDPLEQTGCLGRAPTLLERLQSAVLEARVPRGERARLDAMDHSIEIHSCHGPAREVEVLHDRILAWLEADSTLRPVDIVVMCPDVETYAPFVEATFRVPFRIGDRPARKPGGPIDALLALLDLVGSRLGASAVLDVLAMRPIASRFGIAPADFDSIASWIEHAGIRWGWDVRHREMEQGPADAAGTWRDGLDGLLLGWAMDPDAQDGAAPRWGGLLPVGCGVEGTDARRLGSLIDACETLLPSLVRMREPCSMRVWSERLDALIRVALDPGEDAHELQALRAAIEALARAAERAGHREPIDAQAVRTRLLDWLGDRRSSRGLFARGVTVCELVPRRLVTARVVALLGVSDRVLPRADLVQPVGSSSGAARGARPSSADDDRHAVLAALLGARDRFFVSYVGQSIADGGRLAPSALVADLIDACAQLVRVDEEGRRDALERRLVVQQPLVGWSPVCFGAEADERIRSFDERRYEAACAALLPAVRTAFVSGPIVGGPRPPQLLRVEDLVAFLRSPSRHFVRNVLRITLTEADEGPSDVLPLELDPLARWRLMERLLDRECRGAARARRGLAPGAADAPGSFDSNVLDATLAWAQTRALLPPGPLGVALFNDLDEVLQRFYAQWHAALPPTPDARAHVVLVDGVIEDIRIVARLDVYLGQGHGPRRVQITASRLGGWRVLQAWVEHLVLAALSSCGGDARFETVLIGQGKASSNGVERVRFKALEPTEARLRLAELVALYRSGFDRPVPLFQHASRAWVDELLRRRRATETATGGRVLGEAWPSCPLQGPAEGVKRACNVLRAFRGGSWKAGRGSDLQDPYVSLLWSELDCPCAIEEFPRAAMTVYEPLLAHLEPLGSEPKRRRPQGKVAPCS